MAQTAGARSAGKTWPSGDGFDADPNWHGRDGAAASRRALQSQRRLDNQPPMLDTRVV